VISPKRKRTVQNRHPDFFAKVLNVQMVPQDKSAQRERVREREGKKEREKRERHTHTLAQKYLIELLMWNASYVQKHSS
jgi:hypothetical protein